MIISFAFLPLCLGIKYTISADRKTLTISGLKEVIDMVSYQDSGPYQSYTKVIIKYGIIGLGRQLFSYSSSLRYVELPETLETIESSCFYGCSQLQEIRIPNGVKYIPESCFQNCQGLNFIELPGTLESISTNLVFTGCKSLQKFITNDNGFFSTLNNGKILVLNKTIGICCVESGIIMIPETIETISSYFINSQKEISDIQFKGKNLKNINDRALRELYPINKLILPEGLLCLGSNFVQGRVLNTIVLPSSLINVSVLAFADATALQSIEVNESCRAISKDENGAVFSGDNLSLLFLSPNATKFTIRESLVDINPTSLKSNKNLVELKVNSNNQNFSDFMNALYNKDKTKLICGIGGIKNLTIARECKKILKFACDGITIDSVEFLGENVTEISQAAFMSCKIQTVVFKEGLLTISTNTFTGSLIQHLHLPSTLQNLHPEAFTGLPSKIINMSLCTSIKSLGFSIFQGSKVENLILPPNLPFISQKMFAGCPKLRSIQIPASVKSIQDSAFKSSGLQTITFINAADSNLTLLDDNCFSSTSIESIEIPDSVEELGVAALSNCLHLVNIILSINSKLTKLRDSIFLGSNSIFGITFRSKLIDLSPGALRGSMNLTSIEFADDNPKYVGKNGLVIDKTISQIVACGGGIKSVFIGSEIKSIGPSAFLECTNLANITFAPSSLLKSVGESTFLGCNGIVRLSFPQNLEQIDDKAFSGCNQLMTVDFGGTLNPQIMSIGASAFNGCLSLESIEYMPSLKHIGSRAFCDCKKLRKIELSSSLETAGDYIFNECESLNIITLCVGEKNDTSGVSTSAFLGLPLDCILYVSASFPRENIGGWKVFRVLDVQCQIPTFVFSQRELSSWKMGSTSYMLILCDESS